MSNFNKFGVLDELDDNELYTQNNKKVVCKNSDENKPEVEPSNKFSEESDDKSLSDFYLSTKQQIKINYTISKKENNETFERTFNVVSRRTYENFKKLIMRYKTHKNEKVNWEEQKNKIKLANSLMSMCYKDSSQKCTFIYPVVIITLRNGKTLTKNYIREDSGLQFTINDIVYNMNKKSE